MPRRSRRSRRRRAAAAVAPEQRRVPGRLRPARRRRCTRSLVGGPGPDRSLRADGRDVRRGWLSRDRFVDRGEGAAPWLFGIARNVLAASIRDARSSAGPAAASGSTPRRRPEPRAEWLAGFDEDLATAFASCPARNAMSSRCASSTAGPTPRSRKNLAITPGAARVRAHRGLATPARLARPPRGRPQPPLVNQRRPSDEHQRDQPRPRPTRRQLEAAAERSLGSARRRRIGRAGSRRRADGPGRRHGRRDRRLHAPPGRRRPPGRAH